MLTDSNIVQLKIMLNFGVNLQFFLIVLDLGIVLISKMSGSNFNYMILTVMVN